jgi:ketosteroid isomerase-like protein
MKYIMNNPAFHNNRLCVTKIIFHAVLLLFICAIVAVAGPSLVGKDGGPTGTFTFSTDPHIAALQREAKDVVERYQTGLNTSDFGTIRELFTPDAVAEWNEKATVIGPDAMAGPYEALFKKIKFTTDFQFDSVDIYDDDMAIVRTHHPIGQTEFIIADGSKKLDFNREIFVLRKAGGDWKIILYTFTTQPKQGEQ